MKIVTSNKKTMVANSLIAALICITGVSVCSYFDAPNLAYVAVGLMATIIEVEIS